MSSPLVVAVFALLDDAQVRTGKPAMWFINPWLYRFANQALEDVVLSLSSRCDGDEIDNGNQSVKIRYASWNTTRDWDPVTGLGILNFALMRAAASDTV